MPNMMTVVETVYHQTEGEEPAAYQSTYERLLASDEQPYERRKSVGEDWTPLDCGWLGDKGSELLIFNTSGKGLRVHPTKEEKASLEAQIIEVAYGPEPSSEHCWLVLPGESMRVTPSEATAVFLRSRHGDARYRLVLIPR